MSNKILVLGGWADNTFGVLRQLENIKNINIFCADPSKYPSVHYSRFCKKSYRIPNYEDKRNCVNKIIEICLKERIDVLLPTIEPAMILVSKYKQEFIQNCINLSVPDYNILSIAIDKLRLYKHAKKHGIDAPKTFLLSESSFEKIFKQMMFPLIAKLRQGTGQRAQKIFNNKKQCIRHINKMLKKYPADNIIIQEYIPGLPLDTMYTTGMLYDHNHKLKLIVPTKKIREFPFLPGGTGVCVKSENNLKVKDFCKKLMDSFNKWEGISDIETKIDLRDSKVKLIEINPRPWGPHYNLLAAEVNLTDYWIKVALKQDFLEVKNFKENVYTNTFSRDILMFFNLVSNLFGKKRKIAWKLLKTYKFPYLVRNHKLPISPDFRVSDPLPLLVNLWRIKKDIIREIIPNFIWKKEIKM